MPIYNIRFLNKNKDPFPQHLAHSGPHVPVAISIPSALTSHLTQAGKPIPCPVTGKALIDTGASICAVDEEIIQGLGVKPMGITYVHTPSHQDEKQYLYPALFSFPGTPLPPIEFRAVIGSSLKKQGIIVLFGRDALARFVLTYNGPGGFVSLAC